MHVELLASIDQKLNIVIYCLVAYIILAAIRTLFQIRAIIKVATGRDAEVEHYVKLFQSKKYAAVIKNADASLKKDPNSALAIWYKAKALYQLRSFDDARELFDRVQTIEPDWMDSAKGYISRIDKEVADGRHDI